MPRPKSKEPIERMTLKLPKSVAEYFRKAFPHGQRSPFVAQKLMEHKKTQEIAQKEDALRELRKKK